MQGLAKGRPGEMKLVADPFARERSVLETGQPHVVAGRRTKDMAGSGRINTRLAHQPEHRVARPERNRQPPLAHEADADEAAGIVS